MSYILDALKKSEQERARGNIPGIQSVHGADESDRNKKRFPLWAAAGTALLVVSSVMAYILLLDDGGSVTQNIKQTAKLTQSPATPVAQSKPQTPVRMFPSEEEPAVKNTDDSKVTPTDISAKANTADNSTVTNRKPEVKKSTPPPRAQVIFETEPLTPERKTPEKYESVPVTTLPESVRTAIPAIEFSGHVYSSDESKRSVMINGAKRRESDAITPELTLIAITPEGAVFRFHNYYFTLEALQDYSL